MKMPLNYAILKQFTKVDEACANDIIEALKPQYGNYKTLKKKAVIEALMTAEANALISESGFDEDEKGDLRVYYSADGDQKKTINSYIKG